MRREHNWIFLAALALGIDIQAEAHASCHRGEDNGYARDDAEIGPLHFHSKDFVVVVHKGRGGEVLSRGANFLDSSRTIVCHSASGCLLIVETMFDGYDSQSQGAICALVDGRSAAPYSPTINGSLATTLQTAELPRGAHTIQTEFQSLNISTLEPWMIIYTMYDGP